MGSWEPLLGELLDARRGRLRAYAVMLAGPTLADDLVQDALIATFSKSRGLHSVDSAEAYVKRAIATKYLDTVRKESGERRRAQQAASPETVPDHAAHIDGAHTVDAALATLAPRERACVVLRYLEDQSTRDTATALGLSEGAVKRYLADGLAALNALLGTSEPPDGPPLVPVRTTTGGAS